MIRHRRSLLAILVAVALAGAACSGGSGSAPSTSVGTQLALTKADIVRNADAACATFLHNSWKIFRESSTDPATSARQESRFIDLFDRTVRRVSALAAPADDRGDWTRFLSLTKAQRPTFVAIRDAYKGHDTRHLGRLYADAYTASALANVPGASYGLHDCVVNVDTTTVPATRSDYLGQVDTACVYFTNALVHLDPPRSPDQYLAYLKDANPLLDQLLRDLRAQPPSAGDEQLLGGWIDQLEVTVHDLRSLGDAITAGDNAQFRKITNRALRNANRADNTAQAIGLTHCGTAASGTAA